MAMELVSCRVGKAGDPDLYQKSRKEVARLEFKTPLRKPHCSLLCSHTTLFRPFEYRPHLMGFQHVGLIGGSY